MRTISLTKALAKATPGALQMERTTAGTAIKRGYETFVFVPNNGDGSPIDAVLLIHGRTILPELAQALNDIISALEGHPDTKRGNSIVHYALERAYAARDKTETVKLP